MKHIVKLDKITKDQQDNLKQNLVNIIMDKNTFLREVNYVDLDETQPGEQGLEIKYLVADEVVLNDE